MKSLTGSVSGDTLYDAVHNGIHGVHGGRKSFNLYGKEVAIDDSKLHKRHFRRRNNDNGGRSSLGPPSPHYLRKNMSATKTLSLLESTYSSATGSGSVNNLQGVHRHTRNSVYQNAPAFTMGKSCIAIRHKMNGSSLDMRSAGGAVPSRPSVEQIESPGVGHYGNEGLQYISLKHSQEHPGMSFSQDKRYFVQ